MRSQAGMPWPFWCFCLAWSESCVVAGAASALLTCEGGFPAGGAPSGAARPPRSGWGMTRGTGVRAPGVPPLRWQTPTGWPESNHPALNQSSCLLYAYLRLSHHLIGRTGHFEVADSSAAVNLDRLAVLGLARHGGT